MLKINLKSLSAAALLFALRAHANDGGLVQVDVLGIAPAAGVTKTEIQLYGKDTERLAQVLPVTDAMGGHSVTLTSEKWVSEIFCREKYKRPTSGEKRNDWMCTLTLISREDWLLEDEDIDKAIGEADMFNSFVGDKDNEVLGIVPPAQYGHLFSVYGDRLNLLAEKLPPTLNFSSRAYNVQLACDREYVRPTNHERRDDYMCNVFVHQR